MCEILHMDLNLKPIFTQKRASIDMSWRVGVDPQPLAIPTLEFSLKSKFEQ